MSIATDVTALQQNQETIKTIAGRIATAIQNQGVATANQPLSNFPALIGQIAGSGTNVGETSNKFRVRYFDFDGTLLSQQYTAGTAPTPPVAPTHQYLTFSQWTNTASTITKDTDIGAVYTTPNTYLFVNPLSTNLDVQLTFNFTASTGGSIDWGDGVINNVPTAGNISLTHPYLNPGPYVITITGAATFGTTTASILPATDLALLTGLYIGDNMNTLYALATCPNARFLVCNAQYFPPSMFGSWSSLVAFTSVNLVQVDNLSFGNCLVLRHCITPNLRTFNTSSFVSCAICTPEVSNQPTNVPDTVYQGVANITKWDTAGATYTAIGASSFSGCFNLSVFNPPPNLTTIGASAFFQVRSIPEITLPSTVSSIGNSAFSSMFTLLSFTILAETPPTIGASTFAGNSRFLKIYVPDDALGAYQAATNWNAIAHLIYPLSSKGA